VFVAEQLPDLQLNTLVRKVSMSGLHWREGRDRVGQMSGLPGSAAGFQTGPVPGGFSTGTCLDYGGFVVCLSGCETIARIFLEDQVLCSMTGTTRRHINIKNIRNIKISLPPLPDQPRIVTHLNSFQNMLDEVKLLQAETETQITALIPSILNRTFMGG